MTKTFAPDYDRNESGWVLFPRDTDLRHRLFPYTDPAEHIAKANMYMVRELVEFVSEAGEIILDPFAGTGTILIAATMNREVLMMELEDTYCRIIELNTMGVKQAVPNIDELVNLIPGDCSRILPIPNFCAHMIFSPPYSNLLKKKGDAAGKMDKTSVALGYGSAVQYTQHPDSIGNLSDFMYFQKMERVYRKFYDSIIPGGTMTVIIKDRMIAGERIHLGNRAVRDCIRIGFEFVEGFKWLARGGGYAAINRAVGLETVDDEDLLILRRPE